MRGHLQYNDPITSVTTDTPEFVHEPPTFSPFRQHIDKGTIAYLVGNLLGICPRTGKSIDVNTPSLLIIRDRDDDAVQVFHPDALTTFDAGLRARMGSVGFYIDERRLKQ